MDYLSVSADGSVQSLQIAVDDKNKIVESLASRKPERAKGLGFVALAITKERPYLTILHRNEAARIKIFHDMRLINCLNWSKAHRNGGELPIVRHEPWVRIGGKSITQDFLAKIIKMFFIQSAF